MLIIVWRTVTGIVLHTIVFSAYLELPKSGKTGDIAKRTHVAKQFTELFIKMNARKMIQNYSCPRSTRNQQRVAKFRNRANIEGCHENLFALLESMWM